MRFSPGRRWFLNGLLGSVAAMTSLGAYAFGIEPAYRLRIQRYAPMLPRWPEDFPLTIAAIADPHVGEPYMPVRRLEEIVAVTNGLRPDLILLLGDYVAGHRFVTRPVSLRECAAAFRALKAPLGTYAILGNHDWWDDRSAQMRRRGPVMARTELEAVSIPVLENDAVRLVKDGRPFWLLGLGDQLALRGKPIRGVDDLRGSLAMLTDDAPAILMAHEPDIFPLVPRRIALTLSGHTHGGQVRFFGYSPLVHSSYGNRFAYGHVEENGRHLIVSGGLGTSIMPVRFGVPPEIVHIRLGTASPVAGA